ncbi:MAG: sporulation protein YtfJ [Clostridiales bacterium]|nr:sporulation protein YtfJ [Clostridiales bacterium]
MSDHAVESMLDTTLEKIKHMVDANSVVGQPITTPDGTTIIPISKISYGFGSGGSDLPGKDPKTLFGAGVGGGVTVTPVAFLSVCKGEIKMIQVEPFISSVDRVIEKMPDVMDKVGGFLDRKKEERAAKKAEKKAEKETAKDDLSL